LQEIIDRQTEPWGVKVTAVEVKDVALPDTMKRAMAKQAEAERERRAKIVNAEGEFQAAEKKVQAAAMMSKEPIALQLRFLQTMREISSEHNTTTFLPSPDRPVHALHEQGRTHPRRKLLRYSGRGPQRQCGTILVSRPRKRERPTSNNTDSMRFSDIGHVKATQIFREGLRLSVRDLIVLFGK